MKQFCRECRYLSAYVSIVHRGRHSTSNWRKCLKANEIIAEFSESVDCPHFTKRKYKGDHDDATM